MLSLKPAWPNSENRRWSDVPAPITCLDYAESFYREAFEQAGVGMAMVACDGRFLNVNQAFCRLTKYTRDQLLDRTFQSITHTADLEVDVSNVESLLLGEISSYRMEKRYIRGDGATIWAELHAGVVRDVNQEPLYLVAQVEDITARKQAEAARDDALLQTQAVLRASTHVSIMATDLNGLITVFNPGAERMLGYKAEEMIGKKTPAIFFYEPEVIARAEELSRKFGRKIEGFDVFVEYARHGTHDEREWIYIRRDGTQLVVNLVVTAQRDSNGWVTGFLGIATDVTGRIQTEAELRKLNEHFLELASVDALTGVANRRSALARLEQVWNDPTAGDQLAIMMFDADHFKRINDEHGHLVGDEVLKQIAAIIKGSLRATDICGRYGGEEFLVACPKTSWLSAIRVAERIRTRVESSPFTMPNGQELRVTVSCGIAERNGSENTISELLTLADERLYVAKSQGRNRVGVTSPDEVADPLPPAH